MSLKVALTHDVDRTSKSYQCITHGLRALKKGDAATALYHLKSWRQRHEVYWNFDDILEIENHYGVKSTFFFLIESLHFQLLQPKTWKLALGRYDVHEPRIRETIKYLDQNGWEVGLHGSYASYNNLSLLKQEKQILEGILGHTVTGIRQHYLNLNDQTWKLQQKAGFHYDASWGYTRAIGYKDDKVKPFHPFNDSFKVFPLPVMDSCYMNTPNRLDVLHRIIETTMEKDGVLVVNWHSNNYHEKEFPWWKEAYIEIIETCRDYRAEFKPLREYLTV